MSFEAALNRPPTLSAFARAFRHGASRGLYADTSLPGGSPPGFFEAVAASITIIGVYHAESIIY